MRKKLFISVMALALLFAFAQMAMAYQVTFTGGGGYGPYQTGSGGEFTLRPDAGLGAMILNNYVMGVTRDVQSLTNTFQTFCIELGETVSGGTYNAILNNRAVSGGVISGGDPISRGTAYLYSQFAAGTLNGYDYTRADGSNTTGVQALQDAIWFLEEEIGSVTPGNIYTKLLTDMGWTEAYAKGDANGAYGVAALNLYTSGGDRAQDVLTIVPIPAAAWLLGSGLLGLVAIRRRMKK